MARKNNFKIFDTENLLKEIKRNDARLAALLSCRQFGMTVQEYAEQHMKRKGDLYRPTRKALNWLTNPPEGMDWSPLLKTKTSSLPGRVGRPPNLWMLTPYGAHVVNLLEPGLNIKEPSLRDDWDLAHRFCILEILGHALTSGYQAFGEHSLVSDEKTVRADVYLEMGDANVVIEVEQKLLKANQGRATIKFENWEQYIRARKKAGNSHLWRLYLMFNVKACTLTTLVDRWYESLVDASENMGGLSYEVYYGQMGKISSKEARGAGLKWLLGETTLLGPVDNFSIEPEQNIEEQPVEEDEKEPDELPEWLNEDLYSEFVAAMETVCLAERGDELPALIHLAIVIHQASYHKDSLAISRAVYPRESIWLMRRYLNHPWTKPAKDELVTRLAGVNKRNPGMVILRDTVTSVIWDVLLYHHGLGRGGALRAIFQTPDFKDITSDFWVQVNIGGDIRGNTEEAEKALGWFLSSLYLYRGKLGLVDNTKKKI